MRIRTSGRKQGMGRYWSFELALEVCAVICEVQYPSYLDSVAYRAVGSVVCRVVVSVLKPGISK